MLETRGLEKRFGGVRAIAAVDFRLERGELRCLIGPNGAGKSTFFKLLTGQIEPSAGVDPVRGPRHHGGPPHQIGRLGIGIKNQVRTSSTASACPRTSGSPRARATPGARPARGPASWRRSSAWRRCCDAPVGELAHGQRQWVEIGMVIAREPELVLLDEPSAGMTEEETSRPPS